MVLWNTDIFGYIPNITFVAYKKTLFEANSLPDFYELHLEGNWDWDAAKEIALKATANTDGDGEIDQWGMVSVNPWNITASNGAYITRTDEDGRVVFAGDDSAYIDALGEYRHWHELGVVSPSDTFAEGNIAICFDLAGTGFVRLMDNMVDEWALIPFPKGPQLDECTWLVGGASTTVLPANANDAEALIALKAFLWREDDVTVGEVLAAHVLNQESADIFLTGQQLWNGDYTFLFAIILAPLKPMPVPSHQAKKVLQLLWQN